MPEEHLVPFPGSYWVVPEKFLAGEYPGEVDPEMTKRTDQHGHELEKGSVMPNPITSMDSTFALSLQIHRRRRGASEFFRWCLHS